jgi:hypothetical protein
MAQKEIESGITHHVVTDADTPNLPGLSKAADQVSAAEQTLLDGFEAIKALGRMEAAEFMATVATKVTVETYISMKESKKYKTLPFKDENGNWRRCQSLEEYCETHMPLSYRRVRELAANYNAIGAELFEQAERLGFRQRDYNALKALPADDRQIIAQAIEAEDLDKALDLMQQLAAKHQREKETTEKQLTELTKDLASKDAVIQKRDQKLNELDHELERLRLDTPVFAHVDWPEAFKGYVAQVGITRKNLKHALGSLDVLRESAMKIEPQSAEEEASLTSAKEILATELVGIHNECLDMIEALGLSFDRSLGAYSEARIRLLQG